MFSGRVDTPMENVAADDAAEPEGRVPDALAKGGFMARELEPCHKRLSGRHSRLEYAHYKSNRER